MIVEIDGLGRQAASKPTLVLSKQAGQAVPLFL